GRGWKGTGPERQIRGGVGGRGGPLGFRDKKKRKSCRHPPISRPVDKKPQPPPLYLFTSRLNSNWSLTSEPPALWASPSRRGCLPAQNSFHNRRKALPGLGLVIAAIARWKRRFSKRPSNTPQGQKNNCGCRRRRRRTVPDEDRGRGNQRLPLQSCGPSTGTVQEVNRSAPATG